MPETRPYGSGYRPLRPVEPRIAIFIRADNASIRPWPLISCLDSPDQPRRARWRAAPARRLPRRCSRPALRTSHPPPGAPTGSALGTVDLTKADNNPFGTNVFSAAVQKDVLPKDVYEKLQATLEHGEALDTSLADAVADAMREWALERGATHFTHVFQPLTGLTAEKHDSFFEPNREGKWLAKFQRQGADPGRAGRLLVPDGRQSARPSRPAATRPGTRPARLSSSRTRTARCSASRPRSSPGPARRSTPRPRCCARWTRSRSSAIRALQAARRRRGAARLHHRRPRAGVLPDRRELLLRPSGPGDHRPDPVRRQARQGPRAGRPLLRSDPGARARLHSGLRERAGQARRADQDPPQRGRPGAARDRADLRELERRLRSPAADHAGDAERRAQVRPRLPAAREALRRRQRLGQAQQLVDGHRHAARTCSTPATPPRTTSTSCSSAPR